MFETVIGFRNSCLPQHRVKYIHDEEVHNLEAPAEIVPHVIKMLRPQSVLDVGCGLGTFLRVFKDNGVSDVLGVDGSWANRELIAKYLDHDEFVERDLEKRFSLGRRFDLVISLEVAEHLRPDAAEAFVDSLINAGDVVLFSAAIPGQGGQNHVNERPVAYWIKMFQRRGYRYNNSLRPVFWNNSKVPFWYKQNIVLFVKEGARPEIARSDEAMADVIHPESWQARCVFEYDRLSEGRATIGEYVRAIAKRLLGPQLGHLLRSLRR